jgi:N-acetylglutamate synthase-like GNAT family acetyltransferase
MVDIRVRLATPADIGVVRDVFRRASLANDGDRSSLLTHPDALAFSGVAVREQRTRVAIADGRVVGFATIRTTGPISELEDLFTDPDWMKRGVGRELVLDAVATAREQGVHRLEVTANPHARDFYERVGFVLDGAVETRFGPGSRMHLDISG